MKQLRNKAISLLRKNGSPKSTKADTDEYIHTPMPPDGYIRLIELLPGKSKDPIKCRLKKLSIRGAKNTYEAISYVWGDHDDTVLIQCDGKTLIVTRNLSNALRNIRHLTKTKLLWADAICINQKDDVEKGHQVKRMGKVYENASTVLAWLGNDEDGIAKDCFALIRETVQYLEEQVTGHDDYRYIRFGESFQIDGNKARWDQIRRLAQLPWWTRAWVIQESALAKDCILLFGNERMNYADFVTIALFFGIHRIVDRFAGDLPLSPIADSYTYIQCSYQKSQTWHRKNTILAQECNISSQPYLFIDVLEAGRGLEASDKRDHVYAFLASPAACDENSDLLVQPEYGKSVDQLYFDVAVALLQRPREAHRVLLYVGHYDSDAVSGRNFPSWVPRWDNGWTGSVIGESGQWYSAGGIAAFAPQVSDGKHLCVQGYVFDYLHWTSHRMRHQNFGLDSTKWDTVFRDARQPAIDQLIEVLSAAIGMSEEDLLEPLCHTLVRGYPDSEVPNSFDMNMLKAEFRVYTQLARVAAKSTQASLNQDGDAWNFLRQLTYLHAKKVIYTQSGRLGIGPEFCESGDICCILRGVATPLVLRKTSEGYYNLVGSAFINGVMAGELVDQLDQKYKASEIILV